jgi:hypothetical protein
MLGNIIEKLMFSKESDNSSTKQEKPIIHPALPHRSLEQIFDNIWYVTGQVKIPMLIPPMKISRSMTVIRNPDNNELTLVNSMRLNDQSLKELESLGKIANVLRIAGFHGRDDIFYKERYGAKIFALEGQVYTREMMKPYPEQGKGYLQADVWLTTDSKPPVKNAFLKWFPSCSKPEAILVIEENGGILVTGDSLQNTARPDEFNNWVSKIMMKKLGFAKAYNVGPGWIQFAHPTKEDIRSIMELSFDHVLPGHGEPVIGNAKEKYRPTIMGDIKGCHE